MACGSECNQEVGDALRAAKTWLAQNNQATAGDPVNVVTGAFLHSEQDIAIPTERLFITLDRHYNNQLHGPASEARLQPFGPGWTHSFSMRLQHSANGTISYFDDRGSELIFAIDKARGAWIAPPGSLGMALSQIPGRGFQLRQVTGLSAEFDAEGRLLSLIQPGIKRDSRIDFIYDAEGRLIRVAGAAGRALEFTYHLHTSLISEVRDHSGRRWRYEYNHHQELEKISDPTGRCRHYDYCEWTGRVADGRKRTTERALRALRTVYAFRSESEKPPGRPIITNWYTTEQRVYLQEDALGSQTRFEYNPFTRTTAVTDPAGQSTVYCFDEAGSTTKVRRPGGSTTEYLFDLQRNLLAIIDPLGHRTEFVDFKDPQMLAVQADFGRRAIGNRSAYLRFTEADITEGYDINGNRPMIRNALGSTTRFRAYTTFGMPTEVLLADGTAIRTTYDDRSGLPLKRSRVSGTGIAGAVQLNETWQYDDFGCCTKHCIWGEGPDKTPTTSVRVEAFDYDECLQLAASHKWTEQNGGGASSIAEVLYEWDSLGRVAKKTVLRRIARNAPPEYISTQFGYDLLGRLVWESLPDSSFIVRKYDVEGHLTESFLADRTEAQLVPEVPLERRLNRYRWMYDDRGFESRFIDPTGSVTTREWDPCGHCTGIANSSGRHMTFSYNLDGDIATVVSSLGHETRFAYDAAARLISRSDNLDCKLFLTRDALGRTIRASNHLDGAVPGTQYEYDSLDRITSIRYADGALESISYDFCGNVYQKRRGWVGKHTDSVESYDFDALGRLRGVSTGSSETSIQKFRYEYSDDEGEIRSYDAIGNMTVSRYDSEGALIERVDAEGRVLHFLYDEIGQVIRRWSDDGSVDSRYSYGHLGLLREATEPGVSYQWDYNPSGRVVRHRQNVHGRERTIAYTYDDAGRLTDKRFDDEWWVHLGYSSSNLPSEISFPDHTVMLEYDPTGRLIAERWLTGGQSSFRYSAAGVLTEIRCCDALGEVRWEQSLYLDERQRPMKEMRRSGLGESVLTYRYDALNRLIERNTSQGEVRLDSCRYEYDEQNNCILKQSDATTHSYVFDAADRLIMIRGEGEETSRIHDRSGLLVDDGTRIYKYDAAHRLREVAVVRTHKSVEFQYSATGELVHSTISDNSELNFYDGRHQVVREKTDKRQDSFWSLRPDCLMASREVPASPFRVYTDMWASVLGTDHDEALRNYDPFGDISPEARDFEFGFASKPYEPLSGLYFNRARFYDPKTGRFTQPDPGGIVDGPNVYMFSRNNPMSYGDPDGTDARHHSQGRIAEITPALAFFPGQKEGRTYIARPGLLDFVEKNVHADHYDANFNLIGRSYIVSPGFLESKPHVEHFDVNWNLVGRSYVAGPGFLESGSHFQHYDADWSRSGRTYSKAPGFLESQPHFQHFDSNWERTGKTYLEAPGFLESHGHFRRYA